MKWAQAALLVTFLMNIVNGCDQLELEACIERLPLKVNQTINHNMLESLFQATSDAKLLEVCIIYETAMSCFERKLEECGTNEDRAAVAKTKRLYNFACDKAGNQERQILTRSASCVHRALTAFVPTTCPISATPYAQKMASCRDKCPSYDAKCRAKIQKSHKAICAVERVKNTCGDAAAKLYTQLQQVMLANDFPIECDLLTPPSSQSNTVDEALKMAAAAKHLASARYRSSTVRPRWFKTSMSPFTIPTRKPAVMVLRGRTTIRPTRFTTTRRPLYTRPGRVTMIWNRLIATTKAPPTSVPITEAPEEEETEQTKEEETISFTTTTNIPKVKKIKRIKKVRRPKTTTTTTTGELSTTTPSSTSSEDKDEDTNEIGEQTTLSSITTTTSPIITTINQTLEMPWRPLHWLSGARTIPDSILIDNFLRWKPEMVKKSKPANVSTTTITSPPLSGRYVLERFIEREKMNTVTTTSTVQPPAEWKSVQAIVTPVEGTFPPPSGMELTGEYVKNAVDRLKKSEVPAGKAVANTLDRLFNIVNSVIESIPPDSARQLKKGFEALSKILLQS